LLTFFSQEHIVQWHPTILSKLALVPQRTINSYSKGDPGDEYQPGDLTIRFVSCSRDDPLACEGQSEQFLQMWRSSFRNL
jgi:mannan polymerase II complex MNN11 subunit